MPTPGSMRPLTAQRVSDGRREALLPPLPFLLPLQALRRAGVWGVVPAVPGARAPVSGAPRAGGGARAPPLRRPGGEEDQDGDEDDEALWPFYLNSPI